MKPLVYFFGTLPGGFLSYPDDNTRKLFFEFVNRSKNVSQIVLHRKDNLIHYGYVRKMPNNNFFGICLCLDCIYTDVKRLFDVFDNIYASMIQKGDVLRLKSGNEIDWATKKFVTESVALTEYVNQIIKKVNVSRNNTQAMPPIDFSISINDCLEISLENSPRDNIVDAIKRYTNVYIVKKESEIERVNGLYSIVNRKDEEIKELKLIVRKQKRENAELKGKLIYVKAKQRNITWIAVLGMVSVVLVFVIWNNVLFPSEVTHYETGEFVYYGPMQNKEPHGEGVAFYPTDDKNGRRYYIGKFVNGNRQDSAAMLYYNNGDYFYGSMEGDKFLKGIFYSNSDKSHFEGTFRNNSPYEGTWYSHEKSYKLKDGKIQ